MNSKWFSDSPAMQNERMLHSFMTALVAMSMIGCYVVRRSIAENVECTVASIDECDSLGRLESELVSSLDKAKSELAQLESEYRSSLERIPSKVVDSELLSSVRGVAQASHCTLLNFRPSETQVQPDFHTRTFAIQLEGKFKDLYLFFDSLEHVPYVYYVQWFKISEPSGPGGACKIDLELKIVFNHVLSKVGKTL